MKEKRSASQILYGHLPQQTVDASGGVWKVQKWNTNPVHAVDIETLTAELIRLTIPWEANGCDGNFAKVLRSSGASVQVHALDRDAGIWVESFPKTWRCKNCARLLDSPKSNCKCGSANPPGQLPFILFHDACGAIREPSYSRCPLHNDVRMHLPGTASTQEIRLDCPECNRELPKHFLNSKCPCGISGRKDKKMEFSVHRELRSMFQEV